MELINKAVIDDHIASEWIDFIAGDEGDARASRWFLELRDDAFYCPSATEQVMLVMCVAQSLEEAYDLRTGLFRECLTVPEKLTLTLSLMQDEMWANTLTYRACTHQVWLTPAERIALIGRGVSLAEALKKINVED